MISSIHTYIQPSSHITLPFPYLKSDYLTYSNPSCCPLDNRWPLADVCYNEFDHLIAQNAGLRHVERGGHQALEHWLLRTVLINSYLLALCSDVPEHRQVSFRSQQDFRRQLISSLLTMGRDSEICPKRRISQISQGADQVPIRAHEQVKLSKIGECVCCKGLRFGDRPRKRVALAQIAANEGRESLRKGSFYGCKQCNVHLCKNRGCFNVFHSEK